MVFADQEHCERSIPARVRQHSPCCDCTYPLRQLSYSRGPSADGLGRYSADNLADTTLGSLITRFRACVKSPPGGHILAELGRIIRSSKGNARLQATIEGTGHASRVTLRHGRYSSLVTGRHSAQHETGPKSGQVNTGYSTWSVPAGRTKHVRR